ncbi:MAG: thiamine-monophosphate kinase [Planctomycetota bacterium]|jgi:thiamine-monophosphate kinase
MHAWLALRAKPKSLAGSVGHDAAVLKPRSGRSVVCLDQTIEGVHFDAAATPKNIANKAVGRALSDLAATAAWPRQILLGLSAPSSKTERWMRAVLSAAANRASDFGAELVAGDLSASPGPVHLSVTAIGELDNSLRPPGRDRARSGQLLLLTGPTGGSLRGRHLNIEPRIAMGHWLHSKGATAMMDVSDGLALDLTRIGKQSKVGIELHQVLIHKDAIWCARRDKRSAWHHAMTDGEDHELIVTIGVQAWERIKTETKRRFPTISVVGKVVKRTGLRVKDEQGQLREWKGSGGWVHG